MQADYVLDYDVLSQAREHRVFLLARIEAGRNSALTDRQPLNMSVVLDRSGSMRGDKLSYVKDAAQFLVQHLGARDTFSLVSYDNHVRVDIAPQAVMHKDQINQLIRRLGSGGSTNLSGGWLQGCHLVDENLDDTSVNRVLLLTDGLANQGITDVDRLVKMAGQQRAAGITTTTMGVGLDFNEDLLTRMAAAGGGSFYFIDNPDQAPAIFAQELDDLLNVVGQNLTITLTPSLDIDVVRQLNTYPAGREGGALVYRLGDLYADEIKLLMLELHIPALEALGEVEVAVLRFDYDELGPEAVTHRTLELPIVVNAVAELTEARERDREVVKTQLMLEAARAREEAVTYADRGDYETASNVLSSAADAIEGSDIEDDELQTEHDMLREEAVDMELGADRYDSYTRKTSTTFSSTGTTRMQRFSQMKSDMHRRKKSSREALERGGPPPTWVRWGKDQAHDLTGGQTITIGRSDDNDIVIPDEEVSTHHAIIQRDGSDLYLEDLGSANGTFANGGLVEDRFRLSVGDVVTVGRVLFRFE